ncbi:MobC family plasmid mobilization relaxosome protein [Halomonas alkaliphila]|uniref:MobC family plasmid mobilization relaxosome protein n=2 Tax=Vreelandella alkaliphila TaxID=272774 RepID=A0A7C9K6J4_9GAMM|nr:MobC family plasmid mobilization relaxosome protein [Halomonas alkaliphila]
MPRVEVRLTDIEKKAWVRFCKANGQSESDMLRRMIRQVSGSTDIMKEDEQEEYATRISKVTIRLTPVQACCLQQHARSEGYPNRSSWVTAMVLAELHQEPVLTDEEVNALRESNRELRAIGKNLNQISKVLNIEFRESDKLKQQAIMALSDRIEQHKGQVASLLSRSMNRWRDDE